MDDIYIKAEDLNKWILKHLPKKDLISIDDLISAIEDMDFEISKLESRIEELENPEDLITFEEE